MVLYKIEKASRNILLMYASTIIGGMLFFLPILALYYEESLFSIANVAIIFSIEAIAVVLFEIPTGAIADLFGRKKTIVLGNIMAIIGIIFLFVGGSMLLFAIYAVLNAFAMSLASGSDSALMYDSLKEHGKEKYYKKVIGLYYALWPIGASIGSIVGGYLASISYKHAVIYSAIPLLLATICVSFLREPKYKKENHFNILRQMKDAAQMVTRSRQLLLILAGVFVLMTFGEVLHLLKPLFFEEKNIPIHLFGYLFAGTFGFSSIGFYLSDYISKKIGNKKTLVMVTIVSPIMVITVSQLPGLAAGIVLVMGSFFFGVRTPIIDHLVNLEVSSDKRATIMSIKQFIGAFGIALIIPFTGYIADIFSMSTAYLISGSFMLTAPLIFIFLKKES